MSEETTLKKEKKEEVSEEVVYERGHNHQAQQAMTDQFLNHLEEDKEYTVQIKNTAIEGGTLRHWIYTIKEMSHATEKREITEDNQ